ncbi:MAG TPA: ATP synthase subunit I [Acetobacteraceae bacterium]|nr:ATP synthase subunit I [Acetobacteraceae bacterium]
MSMALATTLLLWLAFGLAVGASHFALLRWNAALYLSGASLARALAVQLLRLTATTALLAFAAWHGALALFAAAVGVFLARMLVMRAVTVVP